jgi:hypothetical protein
MNWKVLKKMSPIQWCQNIILYLIGVGIMPLGVVLTINAHLGAGGYDALNFALSDKFHCSTSLAIYGTAFFVLILAALVRKSYPRIETFISSFILGLFTDFWKSILASVQGETLVGSVIILALGVIIVAFSVACYMISIFPTNPTDDFVTALHEKGVNLGIAKISLDAVCVVLAFMLGGEIGVGTILCTFGLGPVIDAFHGEILKHMES